MRIGVLLTNQSHDSEPQHFISKPLSLKFLAHFHNGKPACERISDSVIRILQHINFGHLKMLLRYCEPGHTRDYPEYIAPKRKNWNQNLLLTYPCKDQHSFGRRLRSISV